MNKGLHLISMMKNQRGVTAIVAAITMAMLIGFVALAVDVGYLYATRNELQNVADAAALAATRKLGSIYQTMSYEEQQNYDVSGDRPSIEMVANEVAEKNQAANLDIKIKPEDVEIGRWTGSPPLDVRNDQPDAVRVKARRDSGINGTIATFFARIFNHNTMSVSADATAALTGPAIVGEGELKLPIAVSMSYFPDNCPGQIDFQDKCAGWHNFFDAINANAMKDKLISFIKNDPGGEGEAWLREYFYKSVDATIPDASATPETASSDMYDFQEGVIAALFSGEIIQWDDNGPITPAQEDKGNPAAFPALFDYFRFRDGDENDNVWTTTVPVYKAYYDETNGQCVRPNYAPPYQSSIEIVGFATVQVVGVDAAANTVDVILDCKITFLDERGGGGMHGNTKGAIPNLVE